MTNFQFLSLFKRKFSFGSTENRFFFVDSVLSCSIFLNLFDFFAFRFFFFLYETFVTKKQCGREISSKLLCYSNFVLKRLFETKIYLKARCLGLLFRCFVYICDFFHSNFLILFRIISAGFKRFLFISSRHEFSADFSLD